jgi:hypothetical protein
VRPKGSVGVEVVEGGWQGADHGCAEAR